MGNKQFMATEAPYGIRDYVARLRRLIDALHERVDEVLSEDQVDRVDFIREYRQSLKDGIAIATKYMDPLDDELIMVAMRAGLDALEDADAEDRFIKGFEQCLWDEHEELEEPELMEPQSEIPGEDSTL